jgi:hypothetical protein
MKRDVDRLQALYEQILITEDAEISKYGYSKEFIRALYSQFNIPHDATFVKLTKMPYTSELHEKYHLVVAKIKNPERHQSIAVAVMEDSIYEFNGKEFKRFGSLDFSSIRSAVDKSTIYGALKTEEDELGYTNSWGYERERKRKEKLKPIYTGIFDLLQTKFGSVFHKRIEELSEYIYSNIRKVKLTDTGRGQDEYSWRRGVTDIEQVVDILLKLNSIKNQSKESLGIDENSEYSRLCNEVIKGFLLRYGSDPSKGDSFELFIQEFNKHPSYSNLGRMFLKALDAFEGEVLDFIHGDEASDLI